MSDKELAIRLLENLPEYKLGYVIAYLQGINADEEADDAFCEELYSDYIASDDKDQFVTFEEMARMCGVDPGEV